MRKLVILFYFLPLMIFGQSSIPSSLKIDLHLELKNSSGYSIIKTYWVNENLKFTLKPSLNRRLIQKLRNGGIMSNEIGSDEVLSLAAYDLRLKYYFNENNGIICRIFVTGVYTDGFYYTLGYSKKF